jgi:predicted dehydrogenase
LTAICDTDPRRIEGAVREHPDIQAFPSATALAEAGLVDVAVIVTPHSTHAPLALELLEAGVGVICEKPFCLTIEEATRMIAAARERSLLLTVFHNRRWDADYLTIRQIIRRGLLGKVFQIEAYHGEYKHPGYWWRSDKAMSGGGLYDWGAHFIDWILNLMPGRIESVTGLLHKRMWHDVTNEDHCLATIRFEGGRSAQFEQSHLAAVGRPKWRILGTRGGLTAEWDSPVHVATFVHGAAAEKMQAPLVPQCNNAAAFYTSVADHLLAGLPLDITPQSARRVIAVMELAERSSRSGKAEAMPDEIEIGE